MRARISLAVLLLTFVCAGGGTAQQKPEETPFDPLRAEKSIEVGLYYLKRRNYYAAIERFRDAIRYKPNFALPRRLLGETYEKLGEKAEALKSYEEYLKILPAAEDAEKVQKKIEKLKRSLARDAKKKSAEREAPRNDNGHSEGGPSPRAEPRNLWGEMSLSLRLTPEIPHLRPPRRFGAPFGSE